MTKEYYLYVKGEAVPVSEEEKQKLEEEERKINERKDRIHQNYLKRKQTANNRNMRKGIKQGENRRSRRS